MTLLSKFVSLFRRPKHVPNGPQFASASMYGDPIPLYYQKPLYGQNNWPVTAVQEPRDAAYWRRRNRRASASIRRASEAFAAAVIDALHEGIPT